MIVTSGNNRWILNQDAPVLKAGGSSLKQSERTLRQGTVVEGELIRRPVKEDGKTVEYSFLKLKGKKKEYLPLPVLNYYIDNYSYQDGMRSRDMRMQMVTKKKAGLLISWGLPLAGAAGGYFLAKKKGCSLMATTIYVLTGFMVGTIPSYLSKEN